MLIKGRLIGVVEAINKKGGDFTAADLRIFSAFASQAAVAVENARLFSSLKEEKSKLGTIFSEMADGALLCDDAGAITLANTAARRLLSLPSPPGFLADSLKDMEVAPPVCELLAPESPSAKFTATRRQPKELILAGTIINLETSDPLAAGEKNARKGRLVIFRDETEERKAQKVKRTFLSLISHKLKTPLAAVVGYSDLMLDEFKESPPAPMLQKAAETISGQGKKLSDLVERLLRYVVLEDPDHKVELVEVPLDELVGSVLKDLERWLAGKEASVAYTGRPGVAVSVDQSQMREVVKNLIENGIKFDPSAKKKVELWVETRDDKDRKAVLRVKDSGPGIPPEDQEKIFSAFHQVEAFFTGQIDGWGLGLPYVKKVVESHGGQLELESKLGAGSTFSVVLPRTPP
jgi:signal transduction histidine kinase